MASHLLTAHRSYRSGSDLAFKQKLLPNPFVNSTFPLPKSCHFLKLDHSITWASSSSSSSDGIWFSSFSSFFAVVGGNCLFLCVCDCLFFQISKGVPSELVEDSKFVPLNAEDPRYGPPVSLNGFYSPVFLFWVVGGQNIQ